MRFGVGFPRGTLASTIDYAVLAEKLGFELISTPDHVFIAPEAIVTLTAATAKTNNVKLVTLVIDANRRNPAMLAHQTACLDQLSQGRFILGVGKGVWNESTYGFKCSTPVSRMKEIVEIVKLFWTEEEVNYDGKFFQISKAKMASKPCQHPHPPVWIAAFGKRMFDLAVTIGDGLVTQNMPAETFRKQAQAYRDERRKRGIPEEKTEVIYAPTPVAVSKDSEQAMKLVDDTARGFLLRHAERLYQEMGFSKSWTKKEEVPLEAIKRCFIAGNPDECIAQVERFAAAGATWFVALTLLPEGTESLRLFGEKVLPYFGSQNR